MLRYKMEQKTKDFIMETDRWLLWKQRWDSIREELDEKTIRKLISDDTKGNFVFDKK